MIRRLGVILFFLPIVCMAQNKDDVLTKAYSQTYTCKVAFPATKDSGEPHGWGRGMVLQGQYFATCYHLLKYHGIFAKSLYVIYNSRIENGKQVYDSVFADLAYKYQKTQYDFSKHKYDSTDLTTDFIVLKLRHRIPISRYNYTFNNNALDPGQRLCCYGQIGRNDGIHTQPFVLQFLFYFRPKECNLIGFVGRTDEGSSGSPIYDLRGDIVGVVQAGFEEFPIAFSGFKGATRPTIDLLKSAYEQGFRLGLASPTKCLKERYLKGFL